MKRSKYSVLPGSETPDHHGNLFQLHIERIIVFANKISDVSLQHVGLLLHNEVDVAHDHLGEKVQACKSKRHHEEQHQKQSKCYLPILLFPTPFCPALPLPPFTSYIFVVRLVYISYPQRALLAGPRDFSNDQATY